MIRRRSVIPGHPESRPAQDILSEILLTVDPSWAACCRKWDFSSLDTSQSGSMLVYLDRVLRNTRLFIPALDPGYGISERGGDAILGYLNNKTGTGGYYFFADVSGFTALLTFLTDRFGKEEAGDIMNLGILNRYCLNKMGVVLDHFKDEAEADGDRAVAAYKVMIAIRAAMPLITREVREELSRKLAGKPHQHEIEKFISELHVKASGGLIYDPAAASDFYGSRIRARITWGNTGKMVAQAEKLGGSDDKVREDIQEVKGFGIDEHCYTKLSDLFDDNWLDLAPDDLAVSENFGSFRKVIIKPRGMDKAGAFVDELIQSHLSRAEKPERDYSSLEPGEQVKRLEEQGEGFLDVERYMGNRQLLLHTVMNLGADGNKNILLDESCSAVRDSGILFCNFDIEDKSVLDQLADEVHLVMSRYGIHYKYNIFPKGDFNLMGVLGTMFSQKRETDRYFAEIIWNTWQDLRTTMKKNFGGLVKIRGGMSVGKGLQGPAGDNIINNEETIIGPDCNLAARLVNEALEVDKKGDFVRPSGVLFTIDIQRRKIEHLVQPMPPMREADMKGFSKPVALYSLVERGDVETVTEFISRLRKVTLVTVEGEVVLDEQSMRRDKFLAECLDVVERVSGGGEERAQLISFIAQSGVGKTRRIAELAHWAIRKEIPVFFSECYSWYQGEGPGGEEPQGNEVDSAGQPEQHSDEGAYPFYPFIRILKEQIFRINNVDTPELKRDKIGEVLARLDPDNSELAEQAPVIASFIGVEVPETGFSSALDAEARRNIFYERIGDIFAHEVERQGTGSVVLLCIDDLQWSDRNSLHLLSFIIHRVGRGLVVCVNARETEQLGILLDEDMPVERHIFEPGLLRKEAISKLAKVVLGIELDDPGAQFPKELAGKLEKELESNPFFIIEFCSKLMNNEVITVVDGRCTRFDEDAFRELTIPTKIQGVIEDRISRLPKTEHAAIQFSSVLGNILRYIIIRQFLPVVDRDELFTGSDLEEIFTRLTGQEITRLENEKDPDWVYSFKRALIGEKLYQELVPSLRKRLHNEVAGVFEKTGLANKFEKALLTALHYSNAEVPDKSCSFYLQAGKLAREVFDNERSLLLFNRIENILSEYKVENADGRRMEMLEDRGQVNVLVGQYDKALEDFNDLVFMASSAGETEKEAMAMYLTGGAYFQRATEGDYTRAIEQFAKAADKTGDDLLLAKILTDKARAHLEKGERDEAIELLDSAEAALERSIGDDEPTCEELIFKAGLERNRGSALHRLGRYKQAIEIYEEALKLVDDESENRFNKIRALLLNSIGLSLMKAFKLDESMVYFEKALGLAGSIGDLKTQLMVRINMGVVANDMGRNREALEMLSEQHDMLKMLVGETRELAAMEFNIGESHMFLEDFDKAEPWYRRALRIGESLDYKEFIVATRYNLGETLHTLGRSGEAVEALEPAYEMSARGGWDIQRLDIANLLGEIKRKEGRYHEAAQYHQTALELSRSLDDGFGISWAMRNIAMDILENPEAAEKQIARCGKTLEESLELARKAGQPDNLMHSLRELISFKLDRENDPEGARPLYEELKEQAEKVNSRLFNSFCDQVRGRLEV